MEAKGAAYSTKSCQLYKDPSAEGNLILQQVRPGLTRSIHETGTLLTKTYRDKGWSHPSTVSLNSTVVYCPTDTRNISDTCSFGFNLRIRSCTVSWDYAPRGIALDDCVRFFFSFFSSFEVWFGNSLSVYLPPPRPTALFPGCCCSPSPPAGAFCPWCDWTGAPRRWSTKHTGWRSVTGKHF